MKKLFRLLLFVFAFANISFADEAPPPKKTPKLKTVQSAMVIKLDKKADEAVLRLSKKQLKELRASIDEADDTDSNFASTDSGNSLRMQTIVGGLFLSLAMVFGGIVLFRSGKISEKASKTIVSGALIFAFAVAATFVLGNAGPPPEIRSISSKLFDKKVFGGWGEAHGAVKVEIVDSAKSIELIVPDKEEDKKNEE